MKRVWWAICVALTVGLAFVGWAMRHQPAVNGFPDDVRTFVSVGVDVQQGDGWKLTTYPDEGCFRVQVGNHASICYSLQASSSWMLLRGEGHGFAVYAFDSEQVLTGRWFSSTRDGDAVVSSTVGTSLKVFVVELQKGEDPWGLQVVDATGALVATADFTHF